VALADPVGRGDPKGAHEQGCHQPASRRRGRRCRRRAFAGVLGAERIQNHEELFHRRVAVPGSLLEAPEDQALELG
jgi:hypothetical protein